MHIVAVWVTKGGDKDIEDSGAKQGLTVAGEGGEGVIKGVLVSILDDWGVQHNEENRKDFLVHNANGVGMVLANTDANGEELIADAHHLLTSQISKKADDTITCYPRWV